MSALSCTTAVAADSMIVYGRLNTGMEQVWGSGDGAVSRLSNYRSVIGFKGSEALGEGLAVVWQIEGSLALDTGGGSSLANRDTRIGLTGGWGTLFAGNWTLPYNAATAGFDPFYPTTAGYMALMGNGSAPTTNNVQDTVSFDRRQQNVVQYWSPVWRGWSAKVAVSPGEDVSPVTGARPALASSSVSYASDGFTLTAASELHRHFQTAGSTDRAYKLGGSVLWGTTRLAAVVERLDYRSASGALKRDALYVSAVHKFGTVSLMGGVTIAKDGKGASTQRLGGLAAGAETGAMQVTAGVEMALSKRTTLFSFVSRLRNEDAAGYYFGINGAGRGVGQRLTLLSAGMRHAF